MTTMILLLSAATSTTNVYAQQQPFTFEDFDETVNSYFDEFSYLCLNLENLGGLDEDNDQVDEKTKQDCKEQLESIDILKKKELIQKYGELDG